MSIVVPTRAAVNSAQAQGFFQRSPTPMIGPNYEGSGAEGGLSPSDLRSAYELPSTGGSGQIVAIVDAFDDPSAESDLNVYRKEYGLPECTKANGCFKKINQEGKEERYPTSEHSGENWALEISLDLDMVSAVCGECKVLLVEATSNEDTNMYAAEDQAANWEEAGTGQKATEISNSWGQEEYPEEASSDTHFDHPGVPTTVSGGDNGYGVAYPAASPDVISVGGTALTRISDARGWSETAWQDTGSGCSAYEAKPKWQTQVACSRRIVNDVSAVASPGTPVSVYDSYRAEGWMLLGGTSVASPLTAGVEALSSPAFRAAGASAFYRAGQGGELFDVTEGENGLCGTYLCEAEIGYDAPTGWGTPDGAPYLPVAITEAATLVSADKVTLHGSVDPMGHATEYRFEYGETTSYGASVPIPDRGVGSEAEYVEVSQPIEGLKARTLYHYRITATNTNGTFHGPDRTFGTTPPGVITKAAREIRGGHATLGAAIDPEGLETVYYFEYGTSSSYGSKIPLRNPAIGDGTQDIDASSTIANLTGGETYHFRVVATNVAGTSYGEDQTFTAVPAVWRAQTLSQPAESSEEREAYGVSCVHSGTCVTVGSYWSLGVHTRVTLAELWNGSSWSVMPTPNPPGLEEGWKLNRYATLSGVSCSTTNDCIAVGYYRNAVAIQPLAEHWDGSEWSMMPLAGPRIGLLEGVSCFSSSQCTAVGYGPRNEPLAERWDGGEWTVESMSMPAGASTAHLTGVSCASSADCMAVGYLTDSSGVEGTLAEHWDGSGWAIESTPDPAGVSNSLAGVSCAVETVCMAVGTHVYDGIHSDGIHESHPSALAERWEAGKWSLLASPEPPPESTSAEGSALLGVSCSSPSLCMAVGDDEEATPALEEGGWQSRPLAEHWNGASWSLLGAWALFEPPEWWHESWFDAASCGEPNTCNTVGNNLSAPLGSLSYTTAFSEELTAPFAAFSATTNSPTAGQPVVFDGSQSSDPGGTIARYEWDFGDGTSANGSAPSHPYAKPGTYIVTLTVTDAEGKIGEVTHAIAVLYPPPIADFAVTTPSPIAGKPVAFDGSASRGAGGTIVRYEWNFGDGASANGPTPLHTYTRPGTYSATLKVTNAEGETGEATHVVTVADAPPAPAFSVTTPMPTVGEAVAFYSRSSQAEGTIVRYEWDFGDGGTGAGPAPSHVYAVPGTYTVTLTTTDIEGKSATVAHLVTVDEPPVAAFSITTLSPTAGQAVAFDGSASFARAGTITNYDWYFGDGSPATGVAPSHTYSVAGSYDVQLVVTDDRGETARVTHIVSVAAPALVQSSPVGGVGIGGISTAGDGGTAGRGSTAGSGSTSSGTGSFGPAPKPAAETIASVKSNRDGGANVVVEVSGAGSVKSVGELIRSATTHVPQAGLVTVHITPSKQGEKLLRRKDKLRVGVSLTFTPVSGSSVSQSIVMVLHKSRAKR